MLESRSLKRRRSLSAVIFLIFVALLAQYVSGMISTFYVTVPGNLQGGHAWSYVMSNSVVLGSHIIVGSLLVLLALVALILAFGTKSKTAILCSLLGFLFICFAWMSGDEFLSNGQQNSNSIAMAMEFMCALVMYVGAFMSLRRIKTLS